MTTVAITLAILVVALVAWQMLQSTQSQRKGDVLESQMSELRRDLQTIATAQGQSSGQIATIGQSVSQRLESVTKALQDGVSSSAQIATQGQTAIATELKNTREQMGQIQKQLGEFQELSRNVSSATKSLEDILGGAKSRGLLGEVTLERLLEDCLPPSQFASQHRFLSGETADAVIFLRDNKLMSIDSKFPLDAFRRISTDGDEARKQFASAVKGHADSIAKKYIVPGEGTLDMALMFVPSESVYYELLMLADGKGQQLDSYCRSKKVIAVSPNTLYAHLCVIAMGLRGMQIEENATRIFSSLSGMHKQLETFTDVFEKLGTHIKNSQQAYTDADKRLEKTQNTLDNLLGTSSTQAALEVQDTLALPMDSNAPAAAAKKSA
ncbi:MAG: DNA recombination protein RmuC [Candidatus Acidiferrum sp.]